MANNKSNGWHCRNGADRPDWFKEHIEWLKSNLEEERQIKERLGKDLAVSKVEAKAAIAIAQKLGVDVTELKKKLKMI